MNTQRLAFPKSRKHSNYTYFPTKFVLAIAGYAALFELCQGIAVADYTRVALISTLATTILLLTAIVALNRKARILDTIPPKSRFSLARPELKSSMVLDRPTRQLVPFFCSDTWRLVEDNLLATPIRADDTRCTHWEFLSADQISGQLQFALSYVHNPIGRKQWELYPRNLICSIKLIGRGIRTEVIMSYHAQSVMDYSTVADIINRTNKSLKTAFAAATIVTPIATRVTFENLPVLEAPTSTAGSFVISHPQQSAFSR